MGGNDHGHGPPYRVPHYSEFSHKGIPQLEELERALAKKGLCDPWIRCVYLGRHGRRGVRPCPCDLVIYCIVRNEAWRYHPGFGTRLARARGAFLRGFPIGLGLTVVAVVLQKALGEGEDDNHH